jgi:hypothetical protein
MRWFNLSFFDSIHILLRDLRGFLFLPAIRELPFAPKLNWEKKLWVLCVHSGPVQPQLYRSPALKTHTAWPNA